MFVAESVAGTFEISRYLRTSTAVPYSPELLVVMLNDPTANDQDPSLTADGLEVFFVSDRDGTYRAYTSVRPSLALPWGPPRLVAGLESREVSSLDITPDGLALYVELVDELHRSQRATRTADFSPPDPQIVGYNNTAFPSVSPDELEVYYNLGSEVVLRTRTDSDSPFGMETSVAGATGTVDPDLSADGSVMVIVTGITLGRRTRSCP
jgi:hypothetical protein